MNKALLILTVAGAMLLPLNAAAEEHHGHGVVVRPFVGGWYAPYAGAYWGPLWDPYWSVPYPVTPYDTMGEVKLDTKVKDAEVFVNGGYVGTTGHNRTLHLKPGGYRIQIREPGHEPFNANVYVSVGKTVRLKPEL